MNPGWFCRMLLVVAVAADLGGGPADAAVPGSEGVSQPHGTRLEANSAVGAAERTKALPPPATGPVVFSRDIKPMLEASCLKCHAHGQKKGGFQVDSRDLVLKGGASGAAAKPGHSEESLIVQLVAGWEPDKIMPQKGPRLTAEQIGLVRAWIDQGMRWEEGVKLSRGVQAPVEPRRPPLPPATGRLANPIDRLLQPYFARHQFRRPPPVADRWFARRVSLDATGLLATPETLASFVADQRGDKRARLVRQLLGDNQGYAEHWMTFWNDALRNDYRGTGFIDSGRKQITPWLYAALATNMPFDRFVARLVNPDEHAEGFTRGIVWRGAINASQTPPVQAAQHISQVFLGINLKCASCHDSFISDWKLADAYGLASIYAEEPLELVRCDKPTGQMAERKFLYPQLGAVAQSTNKAVRLRSLAEAITSPQNGRLTRTIVNRLWARFFGRGLVEPVDEMDNPPWNADLLDWLASDLVDHGYDLKHTMELMLTSEAYQMPAVSLDETPQDQFVFRGPAVRRLTAEQYLDALATLTGGWRVLPANSEIDFALGRPRPIEPAPQARWIWAAPEARQGVPPQTIYLRKTVFLSELPQEAAVLATADNRFTLFINGKEAGSSDKWEKPKVLDVRSHLVIGANLFAVSAVNDSKAKDDPSPNPAGFFLQARLRYTNHVEGDRQRLSWDFGSDATWLCTTNKNDGWEKPEFEPAGWLTSSELGTADAAPWELAPKLSAAWSTAAQYGRVRAALSVSDPLMTALGRPNREQVVTARSAGATTLQALELTNGSTLAELLKTGADKLLAAAPGSGRALTSRLYARALGRLPTAQEAELAEQLVGSPARPEGVADLLWAMTMLPEFQLIY